MNSRVWCFCSSTDLRASPRGEYKLRNRLSWPKLRGMQDRPCWMQRSLQRQPLPNRFWVLSLYQQARPYKFAGYKDTRTAAGRFPSNRSKLASSFFASNMSKLASKRTSRRKKSWRRSFDRNRTTRAAARGAEQPQRQLQQQQQL